MLQNATFYERILRCLRTEGFPDRVVLRTFAPLEANETHEVLVIAHGRYAETVFVDADGTLIHGPVPGFGCLDGKP